MLYDYVTRHESEGEGYWSLLKDIYKMYYVRGLIIVTIRADLEFATIQALVGELPTNPTMELAAAVREGSQVHVDSHGLRCDEGDEHVPT